MAKLIVVLMDALRFDVATETAGYLEHLVETDQAAKYKVRCELPAISKPLYDTLMTGRMVSEHLVTENQTVRRSNGVSIFDLCRAQGLTTAAAAHYWMSELFVKAPYHPWEDRILIDEQAPIQHGMFYMDDTYPDSHLFQDGEFLRKRYEPDFILYHPMGIDDSGHKEGGESLEYYQSSCEIFKTIGYLMPQWQENGYQVVVTADHGMHEYGFHNGNTWEQREVPLYVSSPFVKCGDYTNQEISQLNVAPLMCHLLEIEPSKRMWQKLEIEMLDK